MDADLARAHHRRRQGTILLLLLLGPAPISVALFSLGAGPLGLTVVLGATAGLVGVVLELYRRQRRDAPAAGFPVLPIGQVLAILVMVAGIAVGTFLIPLTSLAPFGLIALGIVLVAIYGLAVRIRSSLDDPDARSALLILGLMACLIALGNSCL